MSALPPYFCLLLPERVDKHKTLWHQVPEDKSPNLTPYVCKAKVGMVAAVCEGRISCCGKIGKITCLVEEHAPWLKIKQRER